MYLRSHLTKEGFPDYPITETQVFPIRFAERDVDSRFLAARKLTDQSEHGVGIGLLTIEPWSCVEHLEDSPPPNLFE